MFNLSGSEIVVILLLALVVLGPEKLPDAIRRFGKAYSELRRMSTSFQDELRSTLDEPMREMRETADLLRDQADFTNVDDDVDKGPRHPTPSEEKPKSAEMTAVGETESGERADESGEDGAGTPDQRDDEPRGDATASGEPPGESERGDDLGNDQGDEDDDDVSGREASA